MRLSDWFKAEVFRNGQVYHMAFERGVTTQKLSVIGTLPDPRQTGTLITFLPDPTIFTITTDFKFERLSGSAARTGVSQSRAWKSC